jgi:hypothetical protein
MSYVDMVLRLFVACGTYITTNKYLFEGGCGASTKIPIIPRIARSACCRALLYEHMLEKGVRKEKVNVGFFQHLAVASILKPLGAF